MEKWREDVLIHYGTKGMKWGLRKALVNANLFVDPNKSKKQYQERVTKLNEKKTSSSTGSGAKTSSTVTQDTSSKQASSASSSSSSRTPQETTKKGKSLLERLLSAGVVAKTQDSSKNGETTGYYKHGKKRINVKAIANRGY